MTCICCSEMCRYSHSWVSNIFIIKKLYVSLLYVQLFMSFFFTWFKSYTNNTNMICQFIFVLLIPRDESDLPVQSVVDVHVTSLSLLYQVIRGSERGLTLHVKEIASPRNTVVSCGSSINLSLRNT